MAPSFSLQVLIRKLEAPRPSQDGLLTMAARPMLAVFRDIHGACGIEDDVERGKHVQEEAWAWVVAHSPRQGERYQVTVCWDEHGRYTKSL